MAGSNGNGHAIANPAHRPATFLQPAKKPPADPHRMQFGQRDQHSNRVDWMVPNWGAQPVSHITTFQSLMTSAAHVYRQYDEALKASLDNARYMRNDCGIMECLEARQRMVALLNWHLEPEDDKSPAQKELCAQLTKVLKRIRRFTEYQYNLQHAIWFGRYGIQHQYGWVNIGGQMRLMPAPRRVGDIGWSPVHGDKLCFRFDDGNLDEDRGQYEGQLGIRVGTAFFNNKLMQERFKVEVTDRGMAYFLSEEDRRLIAVHKHMIEDGEFEDAISAGKIHGVGIRSRIYWEWVQKQETLGFLMEYLERSAGGIQLWMYPSGNTKAKQETEAAVQSFKGGSQNVVMVPIPAGDDGHQYGVQCIEPGMAGIEMLRDLLDNHFGHRIKRYILGQVLTSEAEATGLGSGVADAHMDTLMQIIKYDATNLEETITFELLQWIKEWNFPEARNIHVRFVKDTESDDAKEKLEAFQMAYQMGCKLKAKDVMDMVGAAIPGPDDEVLSQQAQQEQQMQQQQDHESRMAGMQNDHQAQMSLAEKEHALQMQRSGHAQGIGLPQQDGGGDFGDEFPEDGEDGDEPPNPSGPRGGAKRNYSAFNESDHPRAPAGTAEGGQFVHRMSEAYQQHRRRVQSSIGFEISRQLSEATKQNPGFADVLRKHLKSPELAKRIVDAGYEYPSGNAVKSYVHDELKDHWGYGDFDRSIKPSKITDNPRFDQLMREHKVGWQKLVATESQKAIDAELESAGVPVKLGRGIGRELAKEAAEGATGQDIHDAAMERVQDIIDEWNDLHDDEPQRYARKVAKGQGKLFNADVQEEFEWKTIGGHDDGHGHHHAGGTPVQIKTSTGEIAKGPAALEGKTIDELKDEGAGGKPEKATEQTAIKPLSVPPSQRKRFSGVKTLDDIKSRLRDDEFLFHAKYGGGEQYEVRKRVSGSSQDHGGRGIVATFEAEGNQQAAEQPEAQYPADSPRVKQLLDASAPHSEYGEHYRRDIAASRNRLLDAIDKGHSGQLIDHLADELELRLDTHAKGWRDGPKEQPNQPEKEPELSDQDKGYREQARTAEEVLAAGPAEFKNLSVRDLTLARGQLQHEIRYANRKHERGQLTTEQRDGLVDSMQREADAIDMAIKDHINGRTTPPEDMSRAQKIAEKAYLENRSALTIAKEMGLTTDEFRDIRDEVEQDLSERKELDSQEDQPSGARKAAMEKQKDKDLTFDEFAAEYKKAFAQANKYGPNAVGGTEATDRMAELADKYPEWAEKVENETEAEPGQMAEGVTAFANAKSLDDSGYMAGKGRHKRMFKNGEHGGREGALKAANEWAESGEKSRRQVERWWDKKSDDERNKIRRQFNSLSDEEQEQYESVAEWGHKQERGQKTTAEKDPSQMTLAEKIEWQRKNPGKGKISAPEKPQPKTMAKVSGAEYEFVRDNGDGTATVRNEQGDEFSTDPGEPWEVPGGPKGSGQLAEPANVPETATTPESSAEVAQSSAGGEQASATQELPPHGLDRAAAYHDRIDSGQATADEVRAWHKEMQSPEFQDALKADLNKKSVADLKKMGATGYFNRQKKADLVEQLMDRITSGEEFAHLSGGSGLSFSMGGSGDSFRKNRNEAIAKKLESLTDEHLQEHAGKVKAKREERAAKIAEMKAGMDDPKTAEDFERIKRVKGSLTPEQEAAYDELQATTRRAKDREKAATVKGFSGGEEKTGGIGIVKGRHQKRGVDTHTVTVENRLGTEGFQEALRRAKQLGGNYVNAMIAKRYGATPGFQFFDEDSANKFAAVLRGESADRSEDMEQREADRRAGRAETLAERADALGQSAADSLNQDRKTNTARQADMAASANARARAQQADAKTLGAIAEKMAAGNLKHLHGVRAMTHMDTLNSILRRGQMDRYREQMNQPGAKSYEDWMQQPQTAEDIAKAQYPYPSMWDHDLRENAKEFADVPGLKKIAASMAKAGTNQPKFQTSVSGFKANGGRVMSAKDFENEVSGAKLHGIPEGKNIRVHASYDWRLEAKGGQHKPPFYTADKGKTWGTTPINAIAGAYNKGHELDLIDAPQPQRVTFDDPGDIEDLAKAASRLRRSSNPRHQRIGERLADELTHYNRLQAMDIKTPAELRAALREFLPLKSGVEKEDPVKAKERALIGRKIPGFFPTPRPLVDRMLDAAQIEPGHDVLEPSAGKGDILDAIRERHPEAQTTGVEVNPSLRDIISAKGHNLAGNDFLEHQGQHDRIVMNPPFENGQDIEHVRHAYEQLKPGGRLVSVMSAGPFFRGDKKAAEFRDWLDTVGGEHEELPEGSFAGNDAFRQTGVNTRLVTINKPQE